VTRSTLKISSANSNIYSVTLLQDKLTDQSFVGLSTFLYMEHNKLVAPQWFHCGIFIFNGGLQWTQFRKAMQSKPVCEKVFKTVVWKWY